MEPLQAEDPDRGADDARGRGISRFLGCGEGGVGEKKLQQYAHPEGDAQRPEPPLGTGMQERAGEERAREARAHEGLAQHEVPPGRAVEGEKAPQEGDAQELPEDHAFSSTRAPIRSVASPGSRNPITNAVPW